MADERQMNFGTSTTAAVRELQTGVSRNADARHRRGGSAVDNDIYYAAILCPTPLHQACFDGRYDLVQHMLLPGMSSDSSADALRTSHLEMVNYRGQTPLILAVQSGNPDLVSFLIDVGSSAHRSDFGGNNALHVAVASSIRRAASGSGRHQDFADDDRTWGMVDLLVSSGVSIRQRNHLGLTPVRLASLLGSDECARRMLKRTFFEADSQASADTAIRRHRKHRDGHYSSRGCDNEAITTNVSVRIPTSSHRSRVIESIKQLLTSHRTTTSPVDSCADVEGACVPSRRRGRQFVGFCRGLQNSSVVDLPSPLSGVTPLYATCSAGNIDVARLLLDVFQADPDRSGRGPSSASDASSRLLGLPLGSAVLRNDLAMVRLLLDRGASACRHCLESCRHFDEQNRSVDDEDSCDLLELGLCTDWPVSRLLLAGGACLTAGAERCLASALKSSAAADLSSVGDVCETVATAYEATGNREVVRRLLTDLDPASTTTPSSPLAAAFDPLTAAQRDPDRLLQSARLAIRRTLGARVFWAVKRLPLPELLRRFIVLE